MLPVPHWAVLSRPKLGHPGSRPWTVARLDPVLWLALAQLLGPKVLHGLLILLPDLSFSRP